MKSIAAENEIIFASGEAKETQESWLHFCDRVC